MTKEPERAAAPALPPRGWIWLALPFLCLLALNTWHHEPWSDELHAWGLTRSSPDLGILLGNLHYDGHPGLWHLLLWPAARLTPWAGAMQILHLLIGAGVILLLASSPAFSRLERFLLLSNYFVIFEYTVLARNYGITLLLALIYARLRARGQDRPMPVGLLLGLMANTNAHAFMLAGLLALEYAYDGLVRTDRLRRLGLGALAGGTALLGALALFALWTMYPAPDVSQHVTQRPIDRPDAWAEFGRQMLRATVGPFLPVDLSFPTTFAFPATVYGSGLRGLALLVLAPPLLIALAVLFRGRTVALGVVLAQMLASASFSFLVYPAAIRHLGMVFVGFVALLWVVRAEPGRARRPAWLLPALLGFGALGGGLAEAGQWMRPYSTTGAAARWIAANAPPDVALIGFPDIQAAAVAILLDRPILVLECECEERYAKLTNKRDGFDLDMVPDRLAWAVRRYEGRPRLLVTQNRLSPSMLAELAARGMVLTEQAYFSGAERDKVATLYSVEVPAEPAAGPAWPRADR